LGVQVRLIDNGVDLEAALSEGQSKKVKILA
jgi:hypothetical protein